MKKNNIDWGLCIDMDEYIYLNDDKGDLKLYLDSLKGNIGAIRLQQIEFLSRFANPHKLVTNITEARLTHKNGGWKHIFRVKNVHTVSVHKCMLGKGYRRICPSVDTIRMNHYKLSLKNEENRHIDTIQPHIKQHLNTHTFIDLKKYIHKIT